MSFYPKKISERFQNPRFASPIANANAVGTAATFVCGAVLKLSLQVEPQTKEILAAQFQTSGCGNLVASADALLEKIVGKKLTELHGLDKREFESGLAEELGGITADRTHCVELSIKTLHESLANFRVSTIDEFTGEKALICTCFSVSEETIETSILINSLETVEAVGDCCNAGTGCGSCQPLIQEILDSSHDVFN